VKEDYRGYEIDKERVRGKLRGMFQAKNKKTNRGEKAKKKDASDEFEEDEEEEEEEDDEEDDMDEDELDSDELEDPSFSNFHHPNDPEYHKFVPEPWSVDMGARGTVFILSREVGITPSHPVGHDDIHLNFTIKAPSIDDIDAFNNEVDQGEELDLEDETVTSEIRKWNDKSWSVKVATPPPLKPMDFTAGKTSKLSWIRVPAESKSGKQGPQIGDLVEKYVSPKKPALNVGAPNPANAKGGKK